MDQAEIEKLKKRHKKEKKQKKRQKKRKSKEEAAAIADEKDVGNEAKKDVKIVEKKKDEEEKKQIVASEKIVKILEQNKEEVEPSPIDKDVKNAEKRKEKEKKDVKQSRRGEEIVSDQEAKRPKTVSVEPSLDLEAKRRKKLLDHAEKLPDFMKQARVISASSSDCSFAELGLSSRVLELLTDRMEFAKPFPVQTALIPFVMSETRFSGGDALIMSATGSGKTLAFAVPVVELVAELSLQSLSCLCVLPTKDIALQVFEVFAQLCEGSNVRVALLSGDRSFFAEQTALQELPQIVVCTPGRLRDHLLVSISADSLHGLRWLVIDEGDRLLGDQYHQWLEDIMPMLRHPVDFVDGPFSTPPLQKLVFSATMTSNPRKLAKLKLYRPVFFHTSDATSATSVTQSSAPSLPSRLKEHRVLVSSEDERPVALMWLLKDGLVAKRPILVFINSVERGHMLHDMIAPLLAKRGIAVGIYTSRLHAQERADNLSQFKTGKLDAMIVTDVLARGLDLPNVAVVNYDTPFRPEAYVHRVGRAARAGNEGEAYVFGLWTELARWSNMRGENLQGGNLVAKKLKPPKKEIDAIRPEFVDQIEALKRRKRNPAAMDRLEQERMRSLQVPLQPDSFEQAIAILKNNKKIV